MRRNGSGTGNFLIGILLGLLVGIVLLVLVALATSTSTAIQSGGLVQPTQAPSQSTNPPGGSQGGGGNSPMGSITVNARVEWNQLMAKLATIPQTVINWLNRTVHIDITLPTLKIAPTSQ